MASIPRAFGRHGGGDGGGGAGAAPLPGRRGSTRRRLAGLPAVRLAAALLVCAGLHLAPGRAEAAETGVAESDPPGPIALDTTSRYACTRDVLSARLGVGAGGDVRGFDAAAGFGSLSRTGFAIPGKRYAIDAMGVVQGGDGALRVSLASALESDHGLVLHVGDGRFAFSDATYRPGSHTVEWAGAGLAWTPGGGADVRIAQRIRRNTGRDVVGKPVLQRSDRLPYADGDTVKLIHGNKPLKRDCLPPPGAFRVTENGSPVAVRGVSIRYATVTLTLERALAHGAEVTVSYAPPEDNALQNGYATQTDAFADVPVDNRTAAPAPRTPPVALTQMAANDVEYWSANLRVKSHSGGLGCDFTHSSNANSCRNLTTLTDDEFFHLDREYTVAYVALGTTHLQVT